MAEMNGSTLELCSIEIADRALLLKIYESSREQEFALVQWDDAQKRAFCEHQFEAQTRYYKEKYPNAEHRLIVYGGQKCGRLYLDRGESEYAILDITVLPQFRRGGIGGSIINEIALEADTAGRAVRIYVDDNSPFLDFFLKRGFQLVSSADGRHLMVRNTTT